MSEPFDIVAEGHSNGRDGQPAGLPVAECVSAHHRAISYAVMMFIGSYRTVGDPLALCSQWICAVVVTHTQRRIVDI